MKQFRLFGTIINDDSERWSLDDVTPSQFNAFLRTVPAGEDIEIAINSPGGSITAGIAIANMVKGAANKITARVYGIAASMASVIACAAPDLRMFRSSFMMIHNPWGSMTGEADQLRQAADVLDSMKAAMMDFYASKFPGVDKAALDQLVSEETWMLGSELTTFGLAATIEDDPIEMAACVKGPAMFAKIPDAAKRFYAADPAMKPLPPPQSPEVLALVARAETFAAELTAAKARIGGLVETVAARDLALQQAQAKADAAETQRRDHQARADRLTAELEQARTSHVAAISERDGKITTLTASQTALEARLAGMTLNALKTPFDAVATTWDGALKECGGSYEAAKAKYPQLAADYQKTHSGK